MQLADLQIASHVAHMNDDKVYRNQIARMFASDLLEPFSKTPPIVPALIYVPMALWFLVQAVALQSVAGVVAGVVAGLFVWTFAEYTLHRFVFHFDQSTALGRWLYFYTHGIHHAYPDDYYRLVMVPAISLPLALLFYTLFAALLPAAWVPAFFAGFVVGYLGYDYTHFATHFVKGPSHPSLAWLAYIMKVQRKRHMTHHFKNHDKGYGVSTGLWDVIFRTRL